MTRNLLTGTGSFSQQVKMPDDKTLIYRFSFATGMASGYWRHSYRQSFGFPVPEWVELVHPYSQSRLIERAIETQTELQGQCPNDGDFPICDGRLF